MSKKGKYNNPFQATLKGITDLYGDKSASVSLPEDIDLSDKKVMIIGASTGLGFAAAEKIAQAGAELIMVMRSGIPEKGELIKSKTGNDRISMYYVDLLDFDSINQLIENLQKDNIQIDILISNAAMVPLKSRKSAQGLEEMFMVNYLSAFYLINKLVNGQFLVSSEAQPGRIIIVSSESHRNPEAFNWEEFGQFKEYGIGETVSRYGYFKLFLTTFANALSQKLVDQHKPIDVRILCPGPVNSNIAREAPAWLQPILKGVFSLFFKSPAQACEPIIYFAAEQKDDAKPIDYMFLMQPKEMDKKAMDSENGEQLWNKSEALIKELGYSLD